MGIIEDSIFTIYKKALEEGDMDQASHAVDLIRQLRVKIDAEAFKDYELQERVTLQGNFYEPFPYRYYESDRIVVLNNSAILLTHTENKLFQLLTQYETQGLDIKPITHDMIKKHMWNEQNITSNALRIAVKRIRAKIETNHLKPKLIINFYQKGYLFLGRRVCQK